MSWKPTTGVQKSTERRIKRLTTIRGTLVDAKQPASNPSAGGKQADIHKAIKADPNGSLDVIVASGLRPSDFAYKKQ